MNCYPRVFSKPRALRCTILLLPLLVLSGCSRLDEDAAPVGDLTMVEPPISGSAAEPNLAVDADGKVYLSWIELQPDSTHALRLSVLRDSQFDTPRTIAAGQRWFVNWADFPMLSVNRGVLAAHWLQRGGPGRYNYGVRVALSSDGGATWSAPITPHRDTVPGEHGFVSLYPLGDGFGAIWLDARDGGGEHGAMSLRSTTISSSGQLGEDVQVDDRTCDCCQTSVAVSARGPIAVYRDRTADEIRDISVARFENGRWSHGKPVRNDGWQVNYCPVNGPAIAAREHNVAVAWFTAADSLPRVYISFSMDDGVTFGEAIRVDAGNPAGRVDVQLLDDGDALVTWLENQPDPSLRVRRVSKDGATTSAHKIQAMSTERPSGFPHVVVTGSKVVFAWTEPGKPSRVRAAVGALLQ
jgi:hypothetical protein